MSCARSRTKASPWLPAICWRVIVFVIGENRSFVWIVPDLFFQSQSTDKEVGLSPESVSLACLPRRPLAGPRAPVPSSCTWSFRLRSSARSSSPTDWELCYGSGARKSLLLDRARPILEATDVTDLFVSHILE